MSDLLARLQVVESRISEYTGTARFEAERAITNPSFAPGPSHTHAYRELFNERETLRAALGLPPAALAWPLDRSRMGQRTPLEPFRKH